MKSNHIYSLGSVTGVFFSIALALVVPAQFARAQVVSQCGDIANAYGPFDYADPTDRAEKLKIVETFHFTPKVETLQAGQSGSLAGDLDYVLRAFPNHTRALWAVVRYQLTLGHTWSPGDAYYSVDCYFDRALRWRPNDPSTWMLFGMYLQRKGELQAAIEKYERALQLQPDSAEINYNFGLALVDAKQYERAKKLADKAYAAGYPLPGLRNRLQREGYWQSNSPK